MDIHALKEKTTDNTAIELPYRRRGAGLISRVLLAVSEEAMQAIDIAKKLNLKERSVYNALRRLEKKKDVVAVSYEDNVYFVSRKIWGKTE